MPSIPSHSRRILFLFALSIPLSLPFLISFSHHSQTPNFLPFSKDPLPPAPAITPTYPSLRDGSWRALAEPIKSREDLVARYPGSEGKINNRSCSEKPGGESGWERLFEVASWNWVDEGGKRLGWDAKGFAVECLKREGGLILVGDSLTLQHYDAMFLLLQSLSLSFSHLAHHTSPIIIHRNEQLQGRMPVHQTLSLNLDHPASAELMLEAGVDASRGDRPLVRALRSDLLGRREDLEMLMGQKQLALRPGRFFALMDWLPWVEEANDQTSPSSPPTVVVLNTGVHWGVYTFNTSSYPLPLEGLFQIMGETVHAAILPLLNLPHIHTIIRTSVPGQVSCSSYAQPLERSLIPPTASLKGWHGWDLVSSSFNSLLRTEFEFLEANAVGRVTLMDAELQGMMRADARRDPDRDCLHFCQASVPEEWARWIWEVLRLG